MPTSAPPLMTQAIVTALLAIAGLVIFLLRFARGRLWVGVALGIALLDQVSKLLVIHFLRGGRPVALPGSGALVYFENRLLGFGSTGADLLAATLGSVVALILLILLYLRLGQRNYRMGFVMQLAAALILGGCLGILVDRMGRGFVIDWLDFGAQSDFIYNLADLAMLGATALIMARVMQLVLRKVGLAPAWASIQANASPRTAEQIGRRAARAVRARFNSLSARELAAVLGVTIEHRAAPPPALAGLRVRSEYLADGAAIVLYDEAVREFAQLAAAKRPAWRKLDFEAMHILHELYHHLEASPSPQSERAAHYFVAELLGLEFSPEELDSLYDADRG